jgi:hypothetical protein
MWFLLTFPLLTPQYFSFSSCITNAVPAPTLNYSSVPLPVLPSWSSIHSYCHKLHVWKVQPCRPIIQCHILTLSPPILFKFLSHYLCMFISLLQITAQHNIDELIQPTRPARQKRPLTTLTKESRVWANNKPRSVLTIEDPFWSQ